MACSYENVLDCQILFNGYYIYLILCISLVLSQVLYNVFDAFVSLGGSKINAAEIIKGIGMT